MAKRIQRTVSRPSAAGSKAASGAAAGPVAGGEARRKRSLGRRVSTQVVTEFTVQLATLSGAGIPIVRALGVLEGQARPGPFKEIQRELLEDVSAGTPLSESMGKHERAFGRLYTSMVRAGEIGGVLDTILERLAEFREKAAEIKSKTKGAMIYPMIIVIVAVGVVAAVMTFVIPRFREIFDSFGIELPWATQVLLNTSDFIVHRWYVVFGVPALLLFMHLSLMAAGGKYRFFVHGLLLRIPILGGVLLRAVTASFARTFGTLIQAGVPHLDALGIVRDTTSNDVVGAAIEDVRRVVREGEGISQPMADSGVFDDLVVNMVDVGEATGELDTMLLRVADAYEKQLDRKIDAMFKILEPGLLIIMAFFVGFIVFALFLPLLQIMSTIGQA